MNQYEQKDNTGALFVNDRREKETQPNARGSALIDGVEYWVSAWTNTSSKGVKYQSLKFERKEEQAGPALAPASDDMLADIPF